MSDIETVHGVALLRGALNEAEQGALVAETREIAGISPPFSPMTPWGKPMSVLMSGAGRYCWYSDRKGYRYVETHPETGQPFPPIPEIALTAWRRFETRADPDCCLINFYPRGAKMGLHQDKDEADFSFPVVSISLGNPALFRIGGTDRKDPTHSFWLESGDAMALSGESRLAFHGIDRIRYSTHPLLLRGGRLNLTLRRVAPV